ncbi:hypothetical protein FA95DRAFT_409471 [Auriscalpium vulgare]|uniref:Uncharacterized protein n=1 Tax=Auriscalpium vulgare TaxID=40419 RepID=A0ACB8RH21_9AGAM|nr:hypothetical protein FA95DRAFT_409471 [Auriscalpium vulgare]
MDTAHVSSDSSHTEPDSQGVYSASRAREAHSPAAPESPPPRPQHLSPRRRSRRHSTAALPGSPSSSRKAGKRPRHSEPAHRADAENADAPSSSRLKTVNAQYEINPAANRGRAFQYDEVVRGKQHRHALGATSCDDCRDYYAAVGPLPPRLHAPAWRTPPSSPVHSRDRGHPEHGIRQHQKEISRHRAQWPRPPTPPGYWDIGFPDTQEATAINAQAAKMHEQKFAQIAREAEREGGRYRRRE